MSLQEKLDKMRSEFVEKAPKDALEIMHRATRDLKNSGQMAKALKKGDTIPEFSLPDQNGQMVSTAEQLRKGPLIISVYRGVW